MTYLILFFIVCLSIFEAEILSKFRIEFFGTDPVMSWIYGIGMMVLIGVFEYLKLTKISLALTLFSALCGIGLQSKIWEKRIEDSRVKLQAKLEIPTFEYQGKVFIWDNNTVQLKTYMEKVEEIKKRNLEIDSENEILKQSGKLGTITLNPSDWIQGFGSLCMVLVVPFAITGLTRKLHSIHSTDPKTLEVDIVENPLPEPEPQTIKDQILYYYEIKNFSIQTISRHLQVSRNQVYHYLRTYSSKYRESIEKIDQTSTKHFPNTDQTKTNIDQTLSKHSPNIDQTQLFDFEDYRRKTNV